MGLSGSWSDQLMVWRDKDRECRNKAKTMRRRRGEKQKGEKERRGGEDGEEEKRGEQNTVNAFGKD